MPWRKETLIAGFVIILSLIVAPLPVSAGKSAKSTTLKVPKQYPTIQAAIDAAADGDTVLVNQGTYRENLDFSGKAITVRAVRGPGKTTIDGSSGGSVVRFVSGEASDSVLEGFTLLKGNGTLVGEASYGGGIFCDNGSSPTISHCVVSGCSADWGGGICCLNGSSPTIASSTVNGNWTLSFAGGGIHCNLSSSPQIIDTIVSNNDSVYFGGGISLFNQSSPDITRSVITGNTAAEGGGGIYAFQGSRPFLDGCVVSGNTAAGGGGGIRCFSSAPIVYGSTISGNTAASGGGLSLYRYSSPEIVNSVISNNSALAEGGGIECLDHSSPAVTNSTIGGNTAGSGGGISCVDTCLPTVTNSILWGDLDAGGTSEVVQDATSTLALSYSDIEGGWTGPGAGNIDAEPLFAGSGDHPFELTAASPCVDAGTNDGAAADDILGVSRPQDGNGDGLFFVDMGAYEYFECTVDEKGLCGDGFDNDCDGKPDCDDRKDCKKDPLCP